MIDVYPTRENLASVYAVQLAGSPMNGPDTTDQSTQSSRLNAKRRKREQCLGQQAAAKVETLAKQIAQSAEIERKEAVINREMERMEAAVARASQRLAHTRRRNIAHAAIFQKQQGPALFFSPYGQPRWPWEPLCATQDTSENWQYDPIFNPGSIPNNATAYLATGATLSGHRWIIKLVTPTAPHDTGFGHPPGQVLTWPPAAGSHIRPTHLAPVEWTPIRGYKRKAPERTRSRKRN
jgi:hypothetical protein